MGQQILPTNKPRILTAKLYNLVVLFLTISVLCLSCATGKQYLNVSDNQIMVLPEEKPVFTLYALGDAGEMNAQSETILSNLAAMSGDNTHASAIIFLGDNIYPSGMPPAWNVEGNLKAKDILMSQVQPLKAYTGQIFFIPGNHDWSEFKQGGLDAIRRQGDFLNNLEGANVRMLPGQGCGGPEIVLLTDNLTMIIIDSQWWIQDWMKEPEMNAGCDHQNRDTFIKAFHEAVDANSDKQIIVALHHPIKSQGPHGGNFTLRDHLFPLTKVVDWLYLPLPVIGSIYPWYRTIFGHHQDLKNPKYHSLRDAILNDLNYPGEVIFLSGHEHNLQYLTEGKMHFIISGSGSKQNGVANDRDLVFGHKEGGFMTLDFYPGGSILLTIYEADVEKRTMDKVFSRFIVDGSSP